MKKLILSLTALSVAAAFANAAVVFDTMTGATYSTSSSNPGYLMGDGASSIASPGAGNHWEISSIDFGMFILGAQTFTSGQVVAKIDVFSSYVSDGVSPVFSNNVGTAYYAMGAITTTGNAAYAITGAALSTPIVLPSSTSTLGFTLGFYDGGTGARISSVRAAVTRATAPTVGSSPTGFYRDANDNGIIDPTGEYFVFTSSTTTDPYDNVVIRFNANAVANPVPEPASMAVLGLGIAGIAARRRRNRK